MFGVLEVLRSILFLDLNFAGLWTVPGAQAGIVPEKQSLRLSPRITGRGVSFAWSYGSLREFATVVQ